MRRARVLFAGVLAGLAALMPLPAAAQKFPKAIEEHFAAAKATMMTDQAATLREVAAADQLALQLPDERQRILARATALWLGGEAQLRSNAPEKAAPLLAQGLVLVRKIHEPTKVLGDLLMSRGAYYTQRDQAAEALKSYQEAHDIFENVKEPRSQAIALQNIALLYSAANDNAQAEKFLARAADLYSGDPILSLSLHNNRGNILMVMERYADAEAEHGKALEAAKQTGNALLEARVLGNMARNQVEARRFDAAARTLERGFALTRGSNAASLRRHLLATAARLAADQGNIARALMLIRQCFQGLDLKDTSIEMRTSHLYAYRIYRAAGDNAMALKHLEALKRLNEEAAKIATSYATALSSAQFDYANQEAKIATLRAQQVERAAQFQRTLFFSIGAAALVVLAALTWGLVSIFRSRNKVRAANVVLGETNAALEKALKAKTEFLATTSHEIRTPLNGILGMTQVMLRDPRLDAGTRDRIGVVHGAGMTMRSLVDDILDVAKMETGNMTVDSAPMDLCATLREVTRMWEEQARAKGLGFVLDMKDAPGWIVSDAGRLRQIVFNLLSNAIKFTETGDVRVRAWSDGDPLRLRLSIADSGIGIPAEKFDEIFESFKQADSGTTRKYGGTGLGLTICRNLAQALGGDISVESHEREGSVFTVDLPLVPAEAPEAAETPEAGGTLLILDRNPIARAMLKTLFEPRFGRVLFAATPGEAVSALGEGGVRQLLIDEATAKAAGGDVFEALAPVCAAARDGGTATSILWLKPDDATTGALQAVGIGQVIEKPIAGAALIERIVPDAEENSDDPTPGTLVSRAA